MNDRCPDCGEIPSMMVKHDCVRNERDRYKAALEKMVIPGAGKECRCGVCYVCIALDALRLSRQRR